MYIISNYIVANMQHKGKMTKSKRVMVSFTEKQWELIKKLKGEFGDSDSDIVRSIVMAWLSEKSFVSDTVKNREINNT